jgi:hypothetical protein
MTAQDEGLDAVVDWLLPHLQAPARERRKVVDIHAPHFSHEHEHGHAHHHH